MNFARWAHLKDEHTPPAFMDWRHVCMIHAVLVNERPRSVCEFGCWNGFSSSAIITAMEECPQIERADFYYPAMKPELFAFHAPPRFNVVAKRSQEFTGRPECWVIDGDHHQGALEDYRNARSRGARIIIIHDTHSFYAMGGHEGSRNIGAYLQMEALWNFTDCCVRAGEFTQRGLVIGFFQPSSAITHLELQRIRHADLAELTASP